MAEQKIYEKTELESMNVKKLRAISSDLKVKNATSYSKEDLIERILDAQQTMINAGILKVPKKKPEEKKDENTQKNSKQNVPTESKKKTEKPVDLKYEEKDGMLIDKETGEVFDEEPEESAAEKMEQKPVDKTEPKQGEQLSLKLDEEPKRETKPEPKVEEKPISEEELQEQRRISMEKYRKEHGYVPPEEKKVKVRREIGGERLTNIMIVAVPIAIFLGIYCGLEAIIFAISKLWYGDLAYVPVNLLLKTILCILSIIVLEFSKYTQQFNKVVDYYANKLKQKADNSGEKDKKE